MRRITALIMMVAIVATIVILVFFRKPAAKPVAPKPAPYEFVGPMRPPGVVDPRAAYYLQTLMGTPPESLIPVNSLPAHAAPPQTPKSQAPKKR